MVHYLIQPHTMDKWNITKYVFKRCQGTLLQDQCTFLLLAQSMEHRTHTVDDLTHREDCVLGVQGMVQKVTVVAHEGSELTEAIMLCEKVVGKASRFVCPKA